MFKVGDRIELVRKDPIQGWFGIEWERGNIGTILCHHPLDVHRCGIDRPDNWRVKFDTGREWNVLEPMMELVECSPFERSVWDWILENLSA